MNSNKMTIITILHKSQRVLNVQAILPNAANYRGTMLLHSLAVNLLKEAAIIKPWNHLQGFLSAY
jgi:hypothetical protein